jgi:DUF4097 and DUF4098 domain-containing protein YvlB
MSNQEMQFADPDWKPSQQLDTKNDPQEQEAYNPQPVNTDYREQNKWRTAPPSPPQQEGYTGLRPYEGPVPGQMQGGNFRQRPYRRRGRGLWFWIILAFIIISLMSGGWRSFNSPGPGFERNPVEQKQMMGKPIDYTVTGQPTIVINDTNGNVQVNVGKSPTDVIIQAVNESNPFGNPNTVQPVSSQEGNTITTSIPDSQPGSADLQVTVPQGADLNIQTDSGDINVNGVNGQMTLKTNSGDITASNDVMSGQSTMTTNSGGISFDGTISTGGSYQFQTNSGSVDLTVPSTPGFHLDASTHSGSIHPNGFPGVSVQNNISGSGQKINSVVGGSSQGQGATVTITTDSGYINLHQR